MKGLLIAIVSIFALSVTSNAQGTTRGEGVIKMQELYKKWTTSYYMDGKERSKPDESEARQRLQFYKNGKVEKFELGTVTEGNWTYDAKRNKLSFTFDGREMAAQVMKLEKEVLELLVEADTPYILGMVSEE